MVKLRTLNAKGWMVLLSLRPQATSMCVVDLEGMRPLVPRNSTPAAFGLGTYCGLRLVRFTSAIAYEHNFDFIYETVFAQGDMKTVKTSH